MLLYSSVLKQNFIFWMQEMKEALTVIQKIKGSERKLLFFLLAKGMHFTCGSLLLSVNCSYANCQKENDMTGR